MAFVLDSAYDALLAIVDNATRLDICSTEPATYGAVAGVSLGNKTSIAYTGPADATPNGRKITVNAITGGSVTGTGTAAYYALTDGASTLYATGALASSQSVTSGNTFSLGAFDIRVADAT